MNRIDIKCPYCSETIKLSQRALEQMLDAIEKQEHPEKTQNNSGLEELMNLFGMKK